jgi:AcrR family transcriptional regulator
MAEARVYESPLRAEQVEQTRRRILEAVTALVADETAEELTVPRVAERARVSLRTVYRHFPTREALFDAWADWIERSLRLPLHSYPETLEGLVDMPERLYRVYDEEEPLVRAMLSGRAARDVRQRTRRRRQKAFARALEEATAGLEPAERQRILAVLYLLNSAPAWHAMREQWGLDGAEAGKAAAWAVRVLVDELKRNPDSIKETPKEETT